MPLLSRLRPLLSRALDALIRAVNVAAGTTAAIATQLVEQVPVAIVAQLQYTARPSVGLVLSVLSIPVLLLVSLVLLPLFGLAVLLLKFNPIVPALTPAGRAEAFMRDLHERARARDVEIPADYEIVEAPGQAQEEQAAVRDALAQASVIRDAEPV